MTVTPVDPSASLTSGIGGTLRNHGLLAAAFFLLLIGTRAFTMGDTSVYAGQVALYFGKSPFGSGNTLWEFGHLLWRPMGWCLTTVAAPWLAGWTGWNPYLTCVFLLMATTVVCGFFTVLMWYALVLEFTRSQAVAFLIAISFACTNAFLTYVHSGSSYVAGLFCVTASVWLLRRAVNGKGIGKNTVAATAILAALGTLFWFPYILSLPAIAFLGMCPSPAKLSWSSIFSRESVRLAVRFSIVAIVCLAIGYGAALAARQVSSAAEARTWATESSHGWSQSLGIVRIATGLPRAFLFMGKDGVLFRRYLRHDPYSPVSLAALVRASLWKILIFDLFVVCLLYELLRFPALHWALAILLVGAVPVLFFAVFIFEPGSPERYFPAYPFLILAVAWVLRDFPRERRVSQWVVVVFLFSVIVTNVAAMFRPRMNREDLPSLARVISLKERLNSASMVALLSNQDALASASNRSPFGPINRPERLPIYDVVEVATSRVLTWREQFASQVLQTWSSGGEVWVSKRMWQERPLAEWNWAEGDDKRISWSQIPAFFHLLETDADVGGPDGFVRLPPRETNRAVLAPLAAQWKEIAATRE
ncbi:MAG TPA: hypothetical protein VG672_28020 [Bryobacteraceae bacterium]|jgi:hypothetical protein|nr:hypothetical protein [Bryobacteraceae bacterium]